MSRRWPPAGCGFSRGNVSSLKEGLKSITAAQSYREEPACSSREEMQHDLCCKQWYLGRLVCYKVSGCAALSRGALFSFRKYQCAPGSEAWACRAMQSELEGKQAAFLNVGWNGKAVSGVMDVQQKALFVKASLKTQLLIPGFGFLLKLLGFGIFMWSLESSSCFDTWMWLQVKLVTGCVLCRACWGQLDTSEALFLFMGINAENSYNKVIVTTRSVWKFFWNLCVYMHEWGN